MQWWIGQVTDPVKGDWKDAQEKKQAEDGDDIYSHRCRVRIVGYHGNDSDLPDKDLPLAHVLLPPNQTTTGGCGGTFQYQGGEVVVGFFFDGEDGQQPVVFGTLFKQSAINDRLKTFEFNSKSQTDFTPYTPPDVRRRAGKHRIHKKKKKKNGAGNGNGNGEEVSVQFTPGENSRTLAQEYLEIASNSRTHSHSACQDNEISKISDTIKDFTKKVQSLQSIGGGANIDPIYGGFVDVISETKRATNLVHNSMSLLVRRGRSWVIDETLNKLNLTMSDKVDKFNQVPTTEAIKGLSDIIECNFEKITDQLKDYIAKSLENMIGQVLDVPICGIENFLGDMFGQINNILDSQLGSMFGQLNNITGGDLPLPSEIFSKGIKVANIITNVLDCDRVNCPIPTTFTAKNGVNKAIGDVFDNIIEKSGLSAITNLAEGIDSIADGIPAVPSRPNCNTSVLKCGPPRVDFIGSSGQGATGNAIVNALGKIIGVAINGTGFGYVEPPLISFFDGCGKGSGAGGYAVLKEVTDSDGNTSLGVANVVITNPGQDYLPKTTEEDLDGNIKEVIPNPNANYDGSVSYVTTLEDVVVQNTGFGYDNEDTATVIDGSVSVVGDNLSGESGDALAIQNLGQAQVELNIQDGLITGVNVVNGGFGFTDLPEISINSDTGAGGRLLPVLKFTKIDDSVKIADTNIPFDRNISQDVVITVISCIEK